MINFPSSPTEGQTFVASGVTYTFQSGAWVIAGAPAYTKVVVSDTAPLSPFPGLLWFNSVDLIAYVYYNDGTTMQWVQAVPTYVGITQSVLDARTRPTTQTRTGSITLVAGDLEYPQVFNITADATATLPALSAVQEGTVFRVRNAHTSTAYLFLDGNASETVNGDLAYALFPGESAELVASPTGWILYGVADHGWRVAGKKTASAVANLDILLPPGFLYGRIEFCKLKPATDAAIPSFRTSFNSGSSYDSGASDYTNSLLTSAAANANAGYYYSGFDTANALSSLQGWIEFYVGDASNYFTATSFVSGITDSGAAYAVQARGIRRNTADDVNAIRFLFSTGNISAGDFTLSVRK